MCWTWHGNSRKRTEVIVTDPQADARFWAEALNLGAYDLLAQPFYAPEVRRILYNACARSADADHNDRRIMVSPHTEKPCPPPPTPLSNRISPACSKN